MLWIFSTTNRHLQFLIRLTTGIFFQNESELIIVSLLVTSLSVAYARKFEMISFWDVKQETNFYFSL